VAVSGKAAAAPASEALVRRRLAMSATATLAGIACSTVGDPAVGAWVTTLSAAALVWNLHRFGRTGPA
jgi:hypothetical protein